MGSALFDKLCSRESLASRVAALARPLVFTNGVFDILHRGHVSYLAAARGLGASLVVGVNSDRSARALGKGSDRPLNGEADRACVLDEKLHNGTESPIFQRQNTDRISHAKLDRQNLE